MHWDTSKLKKLILGLGFMDTNNKTYNKTFKGRHRTVPVNSTVI